MTARSDSPPSHHSFWPHQLTVRLPLPPMSPSQLMSLPLPQSRGSRPRRGASGSRANTPSDAGRQSPGAASTCSASSSSDKSRNSSSQRPRPAATAKRAGTHLETPDEKVAKKRKGGSYVSGGRGLKGWGWGWIGRCFVSICEGMSFGLCHHLCMLKLSLLCLFVQYLFNFAAGNQDCC